MTYDEFAERFLAALYLETEQSGKEYHKAEALIQKYHLVPKSHWIGRMADDWEHRYFKDVSKVLSGREAWTFRISANGSSKIENDFVDSDDVEQFLAGQGLLGEQDEEKAPIVQSSAWTGLPSDYELTELRRARLVADLDRLEGDLEALGESQEIQAQARAYIIATRALAEAPEPPIELIWAILTKAATIATIAQLFLPLLQAIK